MHMRMVHIKFKPGKVGDAESLYRDRVIPALQNVAGCRFAGLLQSSQRSEDCISLTLWNSEEDTERYEKSGKYTELLDETKPLLADSSDSTVRLSEDLTLEYVQVPEEPIVRSHPIAATTDVEVESIEGERDIWVRIVLLKVRPGKREEFKKRYLEGALPVLRKVKGCRHVYLAEQDREPDILASVTTWNSREDAEEYERSGVFEQLLDTQIDLLSSLFEWKRYREEHGRPRVATSDDIVTELYTVLTSRSFR